MANITIIGAIMDSGGDWLVSFVAEAFIMTTYIVTDLTLFIIVICHEIHHDYLL